MSQDLTKSVRNIIQLQHGIQQGVQNENKYLVKKSLFIKIDQLLPQMKSAMSLESSQIKSKVFYIGGSTHTYIPQGQAVLDVVKLDNNFKKVGSINIDERFQLRLNVVFQIRVVQNLPGMQSDHEMIFVSGYRSLLLLKIDFIKTGLQINMVRTFKNIHSSEIFDMAIYGQHVYTVCLSDDYICKN